MKKQPEVLELWYIFSTDAVPVAKIELFKLFKDHTATKKAPHAGLKFVPQTSVAIRRNSQVIVDPLC